jgi:hypothetical protein
MAVKPFILTFGQSNGGAHADYSSWEVANPGLAVGFTALSSNSPTGGYADVLDMPGTWPSRYQKAALKGRAVAAIRYLTFYNPVATGLIYTQFPHRALVATIISHDSAATSLSVPTIWQYSPVGRTIVRSRTRTVHTIGAWGGVISPALGGQIAVSPAFDPPPAVGEQIEYAVHAGANSVDATKVAFDMRFGGDFGDGVWNASLAGLRARCVAGANAGVSRTINDVTLDGSVIVQVSFTAAWSSMPQAGDQFVIEPHPLPDGTAVPYEKFGVFLPWAGLEGQALGTALSITGAVSAGAGLTRLLVANTMLANDVVQVTGTTSYNGDPLLVMALDASGITVAKTFVATETGTLRVYGKSNPYPPGFSYPNHHTQPPLYQPFRSGSLMYGVGAKFASARAAYHTTLANLLQERLGDTIYVASLAVDGTTIAHNELFAPVTTDAIGWFDPRQQLSWAPGEPNGCAQRLLDTLDAAIAAAALEGHTLEVKLVVSPLGEGDSAFAWSAPRFAAGLRMLKGWVRDALKSRDLWPGDADEIPWVWPKIREAAPWTYATTINTAIEAEVEADRYLATCEVSDLTVLTEVGGNVHYDGTSVTALANRVMAAWEVARLGTPVAVASPASVTTAPSDTPEAILAAIDAAIRSGGDVAAYTVNGRTVQLRSLTELITARKYYEAQQARSRGLRRTKVRFR